MANCGLLLNDGSSFVLLNDNVSVILLNDASCAFEPGADTGGGAAIVGGHFTRKQYQCILDARAAQRRAEEEALELKKKKEREAAVKAVMLADRAIDLAARTERECQLGALTKALNDMDRANTVAKTMSEAARVREAALRVIRLAEEDEGDEDDITFLLLH
jgi:hypothetical protein